MNRAGLLIVIAALLLALSSAWLPSVASAQGQSDRGENLTMLAAHDVPVDRVVAAGRADGTAQVATAYVFNGQG
jgi:hypothetical protein